MQLGSIINMDALPDKFPTHRHGSAFWESLGRAVATFGFLEEVLGKAIFAFTATRPYDESEVQQAYEGWLAKLERALTDPLGNLIEAYGKAVREHPCATAAHIEQLLSDLRTASAIRNVLCHASWRLPNDSGASVPFFVDRRMQIVKSAMDCQFLAQVQRHVAELACSVVNMVTVMGRQFITLDPLGKVLQPVQRSEALLQGDNVFRETNREQPGVSPHRSRLVPE